MTGNLIDTVFVYGTLKFQSVLTQLGCVILDAEEGTIPGDGYSLGRYPVVFHDEDSPFRVLGFVIRFADMEKTLNILDIYEGIDRSNKVQFYERKIVDVLLSNGETKKAWLYSGLPLLRKELEGRFTPLRKLDEHTLVWP